MTSQEKQARIDAAQKEIEKARKALKENSTPASGEDKIAIDAIAVTKDKNRKLEVIRDVEAPIGEQEGTIKAFDGGYNSKDKISEKDGIR